MRRIVTRPEVRFPSARPSPVATASPRSRARPGSPSTSTCPASPMRESCAARTPTPGSDRSTSTAARAHPGVIAVVAAADLADVHLIYGHAVADHPLIAVDKVRFAGEPVVGVVADDPVTAEEALRLVEVDYEPLPYVTSPEAALGDDAPIIHEHPGEQRPHRGFEEDIERSPPERLLVVPPGVGRRRRGIRGRGPRHRGRVPLPDVLRLRDGAVHVGRVVGRGRADRLDVRPAPVHGPRRPRPLLRPAAQQGPRHRPVRRRRLRQQVVHEDRAADRGARAAGRPAGAPGPERRGGDPDDARRRRDRPPPDRVRSERPDPRACQAESCSTRAATPRTRRWSAARLPTGSAGPYRIPALEVTCDVVYTNTAPASSFRGFGAPQVTLAGESQMDEAAVAPRPRPARAATPERPRPSASGPGRRRAGSTPTSPRTWRSRPRRSSGTSTPVPVAARRSACPPRTPDRSRSRPRSCASSPTGR